MADRISWRDFPRLRDNDVFQVTATPGTPGRITFMLRTAPEVTWWKAVKLLRVSDNSIIREVTTQDSNHGPVSFEATESEIAGAKLVLAKAKLFGIHTDMYEIFELRDRLGQQIEFNWIVDGPTNVFAAIWGFFRDIITGLVNIIITVVNAVVTVVESIVGLITNAIVWIVNLILSIPIIGRAISLIINAVTWAVAFVINLIIEAVTGLFVLAGLLARPPEKLLRLCIIVQRDELNNPVATMAQIQPILDFAIKFFRERANIKIVPAGPFKFDSPFGSGPSSTDPAFVITQNRPSTSSTLDVRCRAEAFRDDLGTAGANFQIMMNNLNFWGNTRRILGMGAPVCVFAVRRFLDSTPTAGCAVPVATRYITLNFGGSAVTGLAHELGHLCGLLAHVDDDPNNLMNGVTPTPAETAILTDAQVYLIRSSNHCSLI